QKYIRQNEIGIDVGQSQQSRVAIGEADHFEAFFAQDPLAHTLRVRAIVSQQDAAHSRLRRVGTARRGSRSWLAAVGRLCFLVLFLFLLRLLIGRGLLRGLRIGWAGLRRAWRVGARVRFGIERGRIF